MKKIKKLIIAMLFISGVLGCVIALLIWPPVKMSAQIIVTPIDSAFIIIQPKPDTTIFDSILSQRIQTINNYTKKVLKAAMKRQEDDKQLTKAFKRLEKYLNSKDNEVTVTQKVKQPIPKKSKQNFWQKFKSIFKNKKYKS